MIIVILRMVRARRGHAVAVFLLSLIAIGASVAAPVYLLAARASLVSLEVTNASPRDVTLTIDEKVTYDAPPNGGDPVPPADALVFDHEAPDLIKTPGFRSVYAIETDAIVAVGPPNILSAKLFDASARDGSCDQIIVSAGRCPAGPNEIMVGDALARTLAVGPGATLDIQTIHLEPSHSILPPIRSANGPPRPLSVVGVYHPIDAAAPFWGLPVADHPLDPNELPILMDQSTLLSLPRRDETRSIVAVPLPATITADRLEQLHADVAKVTSASRDGLAVSSGINLMLGQFDLERDELRVVPTVAAVALVVLCWFVIFLAMTQTAQARRTELGMLKLRGLSGGDQAFLAIAENLVVVIAGGIAGYLAGHAAIWVVAHTVLPVAVPVPVTPGPLPWAAATLLGAIAAGVLALRRDLMSPALDLMRGVPSRLRGAQGSIATVLVSALAVAAVVELRSSEDRVAGLAILAPALVILAAALLLSRLFDPIAGWLGRRALRRGRLAPALAALHFGRRHSGGRALALLVVAAGLLSYASIAAESADRARTERVRESIGADRVLSVASTLPQQLLSAVRQADPSGRSAMAVVQVTDEARGPLLALDSSRLSTALWPSGTTFPRDQASALRPVTGDTVTVQGSQLVLKATTSTLPPYRSVTLGAWLTPLTGESPVRVVFPALRLGAAEYRADVPCTRGCRLSTIELTVSDADGAHQAEPVGGTTTVLTDLAQAGPDRDLVPAGGFMAWHDRANGSLYLTPGPSGLGINAGYVPVPASIVPADVPKALAMVASGDQYSGVVRSLNGRDLPATLVGRSPALPRVGGDGAIVDLDYWSRFPENGLNTAFQNEVWLAADAPADLIGRLRKAGLTITGERSLADELDAAGKRPEAVGLWFFLAVAILGLILGVAGLWLVAAVERTVRARELRNLLIQGLSRATVRSASLRGYLPLALLSGVLGAAVAELAWVLTRTAIPIGEVPPGLFNVDIPGTRALLAFAVTTVVLLGAATALGESLTRSALRDPRTGTRPRARGTGDSSSAQRSMA